ncbi:MAG TPA: DUF378 domain-containing protein [Beijerinckia sp.]|jgi:uncharacterized membrane protein YuzA (DUF378 family)|nr:DUF378 domain-containing protein [Beijerinckia sp.]
MKSLNVVTLILIILGGLNWGLFGLTNVDLIASLFGGSQAMLAKAAYVIIGLSALYQLFPFSQAISVGEISAEAGRY